MLLIFAYLYSHRRSVLLIDEPDAHLEILRQKQVYLLLRQIASKNKSQVVLVTHSEVILDEALDSNLTLLLGGHADDLAAKREIHDALKLYGTEHYIRARQRGYVIYVEGATDLDILRALAQRQNHRAAQVWDETINSFYVQNTYSSLSPEGEFEQVEGGFGVAPKQHFFALRNMIEGLKGLAILDNDGRGRQNSHEGGLQISYWNRYEIENYFVTPEVLKRFTKREYSDFPLFGEFVDETEEVLDALILKKVFGGNTREFATWQGLEPDAAHLLWEALTRDLKLSDFAEEFFRRLADRLGHAMLLRKGDLHQLVDLTEPESIPKEVEEKLNLLADLFARAGPPEEA